MHQWAQAGRNPVAMTPPRRILICNYEFPPLGGGGGTASRFLARELVRLGHRVEVVTSHFRGLPRVVERGRFRLWRVPAVREQKGQSNPREMISYVISAAANLLARGGPRPDAIVSFHSIPSGLVGWVLSMIWGVPHIVLFRGGDVPGWLPGELDAMHRRTLWLNRLIVRQAVAALANSRGLRDLAAPSFPGVDIGVLANGVDTRLYRPPAVRGHTGPARLIFVGRITTQKGLDLLIETLATPSLAGRHWELDVVGTGPMLDVYTARAAALGLAPRIRFHGWLGRAETAALYRGADILAFPSRYEGMPNVVLEAMASGLAIVSTRIAGTEELIEDGRNGLLVAPDDPAAFAVALRRVIDDGDLRRQLGEAARRDAVEGWSWAARAAQLADVIESASATGAPSSAARR